MASYVSGARCRAALEGDGGRPATDWMSTFVMASLDVPVSPRRLSTAASTTARRCGDVGVGVESEDAAEGASKVRVKDGVDNRVEETVDVAEPCDEADNWRRNSSTTERAAERTNGGDREERQPTDDERARDYGQRPRRLPLSPAASSTLPVATQLFRVTPWRRTSPRQYFEEVIPETDDILNKSDSTPHC